MNNKTTTFGHLAAISANNGAFFELYNRTEDKIYRISRKHFGMIKDQDTCELVELIYKR